MGRTRKLPTINDTTSKEAIEKEKAVQEMLDSVLVYDVPSSSEQAAKKSKLSTLSEEPDAQIFAGPIPKRRDAIDVREVEPTTKSVGVQTVAEEQYGILQLRDDLMKEIKGLRRSVTYSINKMQNDVLSELNAQRKTDKTASIADIKRNLNLESPINQLEDFYQFDNKIQHDVELAANLRELMSFKTRTKGLYEAIGGVLTALMAHELQLLFSGCGKPNKGVAKQNFSATQIYKELNARSIYTTSKILNVAAADVLPIPNNIDASETTRFSPHRSRDISATVILSQNYQGISSPKIDITTDNSFSTTESFKQDPHVQSYDCFGAISLNSAMQSNVPSPFGGMNKFTHLNMPGGQWSQDCKFMSQNLQSSHYTILRKNARSGWSTYDKNATIKNKDSAIAWNVQSTRSYCTKPEDKPQALSKKEQLKKAFQDYGSTIIIFHVAISLVSLGGFYLLVSSGIDLVAFLERLDFAPAALKNSVAIGASNFVIAYAVHKVFAPVRISITLGATPFIVRYLRSKGFLKAKIK